MNGMRSTPDGSRISAPTYDALALARRGAGGGDVVQEDKRISYGPWEKRDDLPPLKHEVLDYRRGLIREELRPVIDRKVSETWIEDGVMMGRWYWESGL